MYIMPLFQQAIVDPARACNSRLVCQIANWL